MISLISGSIINIESNAVTIVQSGIGYQCYTPQTNQYKKDQQITFHTQMHWNQDQGPTLFGFQTQLEKQTFMLIISCSGIGPKRGLSILEQVTPNSFLQSVIENDTKALSNLNGIGIKKAEQLCLSLQSKAKTLVDKHPSLQNGSLGIWKDVEETLSTLNYSPQEIKQVSSLLKKETGPQPAFDLILRKALTMLAQR
jgi:holliday junction DNA helicase RuvA